MAITITPYNLAAKKLLNKEVTLTTIKFMLLNNTATFDATNTTLAQVAGVLSGGHYPNEVYGNGWTEGGETLANVAVTTVTTNDAMLDADDINVTASGGSLPSSPAYKGLLYDATGTILLAFVDFGNDMQAGDTTAFKVVWHANGIFRVNV